MFKADTEGDVPKAETDEKTREVRVTVFPRGGGRPFIRDVEIDEDGLFQLDDDGSDYKLTRGSVWQEGSVERAILHEEAAGTANPAALAGDDVIDARTLHAIAKNNLWMQLDEVSRRKGVWGRKSTWVGIGMAAIALIMMFWMIKTTGDGFEQLADAIRSAEFATTGSNGHNDISPGGN